MPDAIAAICTPAMAQNGDVYLKRSVAACRGVLLDKQRKTPAWLAFRIRSGAVEPDTGKDEAEAADEAMSEGGMD